MALHLPPELWRRIFEIALTNRPAFASGLRPVPGEYRLRMKAKAAQQTHKCISLVCRFWYAISAEYFWSHLVLDTNHKVLGAAIALDASARGLNPPDPTLYPSYPRPVDGMGHFVKRLDVEVDFEPGGVQDYHLLNALATILHRTHNLEIFTDFCNGSLEDVQPSPDVARAILTRLFHPDNLLRRVDWLSNNLVIFASYLHWAPKLEMLNLHYFEEDLEQQSIDPAMGIQLLSLRSIRFREHRKFRQSLLLSTWDLPLISMATIAIAPDFGAIDFLRVHGSKIRELTMHTPATGGPFPPLAAYCNFTPNLEVLHFQLHNPTFLLANPLPHVHTIGIHGLLQFGDRDFEDGEQEQLHSHLSQLVRSKPKMPNLRCVRLVDFDPLSWNSLERDAGEVAKWQRWQVRWEFMGVRFEDREGELMRIPQDLLDLLEERDSEYSSMGEDTEMEDGTDWDYDTSSAGESLSSGMMSAYSGY